MEGKLHTYIKIDKIIYHFQRLQIYLFMDCILI